MSGYAASAQIRGARPRLADPAWVDGVGVATGGREPAAPEIVSLEPGEGSSAATSFADRWDAARERWAQLTFYLFDTESWR